VASKHAARKLKIHKEQNKHKRFSSSLYVYRRNVNCAVGNAHVC